jgi:hypothetical protein
MMWQHTIVFIMGNKRPCQDEFWGSDSSGLDSTHFRFPSLETYHANKIIYFPLSNP